jgi:flagellum-specific peptidoglycan hydrolase FlgJ
VISASKPRWQQVTALVSLSASGTITGFSFVPRAPADITSPTSMPIRLLALEKSAQPAAPASDATLRSAIVNTANYYLRMAQGKTPAEMEAIIWQHDSIDGVDHGQSCAAFASLTLELAAQVVGQRSWVTGGTSYPWPLHKWADVRVDTNPASPDIISVLQDAETHQRWHPLGDGYEPQPGDWVLFNGHVEVVTKDAGGILYTIGGDSLPNFSVNAHQYSGPLAAQGVAGFVNNGDLASASDAGAAQSAPQSASSSVSSTASAAQAAGQATSTTPAIPGASAAGATQVAAAGQTGGAAIPGMSVPAPRLSHGRRLTGRQRRRGHIHVSHGSRPLGQNGSAGATRGDGPGTDLTGTKSTSAAGSSPATSPATGSTGSTGSSPASPTASSTGSGATTAATGGADVPGVTSTTPAGVAGPAGNGSTRVSGTSTGTSAAEADVPGTSTGSSAGTAGAAVPGTGSATTQATSADAAIPGVPGSVARASGSAASGGSYRRHEPALSTTPVHDTRAQQAFINEIAPGAIATQRKYGVPAAVTIAQAIDESGWGQSDLAVQAHNLFGIKGTGPAGSDAMPTQEYENGQWESISAPFRAYHNFAESINDHGELLAESGYYTRAMADRNDPNSFANALTGVYATNPEYGANLIQLMQQYNLYSYDVPELASAPAAAGSPATPAAAKPSRATPKPAPAARKPSPRSAKPSPAAPKPTPTRSHPTPTPTPSLSPTPSPSPTPSSTRSPSPTSSAPDQTTNPSPTAIAPAPAPTLPGPLSTTPAPVPAMAPAPQSYSYQHLSTDMSPIHTTSVIRMPARAAAPARKAPRRKAATRRSLYQATMPPSVKTSFVTLAKAPLMHAELLYRAVADDSGIPWELLAACDWMQCEARPRHSPVHGEKLGAVNRDGSVYRTKSEALEQCAFDLIDLAKSVYQIDLTARESLSVSALASVFAAFRWGGLLKLHHTSAMEFPYSVAGLTVQHLGMRWPNIDATNTPDKPGARFRMPFGAVPVVLSLNYPASA